MKNAIHEFRETPYVAPDGSLRGQGSASRTSPLVDDDSYSTEKQILDTISDYVILLDTEMRIRWANRPAIESSGMPMEQLRGRCCYHVWHQRTELCVNCPVQRALTTGEMCIDEVRSAEDGYWLLRGTPVRDQTGAIIGVAEIAVDVTERKRAEIEQDKIRLQMQHSQKLESLGVLAGGVAHDFNNLLTGVMGNASLALLQLPDPLPVAECIHQIQKAAAQAAGLANQLLAYAGKGHRVTQPVCLSDLVEKTTELLQIAVSKKTRTVYQLERRLPCIEGDPAQLRQVLINQAINGSESLGNERGVVSVTTGIAKKNKWQKVADTQGADLTDGEYVFLEVADSGCGMDDDTKAKIFEPFFTTKITGRGLGLAVVAGVVRSHKSVIHVESEPGRGTTFTIVFRATDKPEREAQATPPKQRVVDPEAPQRTILVIDDEELVRETVGRILKASGFDVLQAPDGQSGLDIVRERGEGLDVVLLDKTMPDLDGEVVFEEIRSDFPQLPVILSSGYLGSETLQRINDDRFADFIQKPYPHEALVTVIETLIDA